ncbi:MAG: RHS repeat protein [Burkholderiales bacterium]|nr:RHS repeat protein [Burkholderiales bacterium]
MRSMTCDFGGTFNPFTGLCTGAANCPPGQQANTAGTCQKVNTLKNIGTCDTCVGNPINNAIGNKFQNETDYIGQGLFPLQFSRFYNSDPTQLATSFSPATSSNRIGILWRNHYDRFIKLNSTTASVYRSDGKVLVFNKTGSVWAADADITDRLEQLLDTGGNPVGWRYTVSSGDLAEIYDIDGKLASITSREGLTQALTYDGIARLTTVTDSFGRTLTFTYDGANRISTMTDPQGGGYQYAYDIRGNLTSVTYPDAKIRIYHYEHSLPHLLTGITDENNVRFATWTYNSAGFATSSTYAGGVGQTSISYANGSAVTDALGTTRTYNFSYVLDIAKNSDLTQPAASGSGTVADGRTFDANGNVSSRLDWNGNRTNYTYDLARNLETARTEGLTSGGSPTAATRTVSTQWHPTFRLPAVVAEPLRKTTYVYNGDGSASCGFQADGVTLVPGVLCSRTVQATSDTDGSAGLAATTTGTPRTWTYTYNPNGSVLTVDGPRTDVSDVTTYTYYANNATCSGASAIGCRGQVATVTNAAGHVTQITDYNAHGQPLSVTDPNGLVTTLAYDARMRLTSRTVGSEVTSYQYDPAGQLTKVTLPDASYLQYTYDNAHRMTQIADNLGNKIVYTLDLMGNRTQEQVFDPGNTLAQTRSRVYNSLNRLVQEIGAASQTTAYTYDNQGNVTQIDGPLAGTGDVTVNAYDALNRLVQITDPLAGTVAYGYNGVDRLAAVTDPRSLVTSYSYDGLDNLNQQVSPDTGTATSVYDAAGNLTSRTDAKSQQITYTYDVLNRVTAINHTGASSLDVTLQYDQGTNQKGWLTTVTDSSGTTVYTYDTQGRMTGETRTINSIPYVTSYRYNADGLLDRITYPGGRTVDYTFDSLSRISQIDTTSGGTVTLASSVTYQPFGGVNGFTFGNSTSYVRTHDQDGRVSNFTLGTQTRVVGYDDASRISFLTEQGNPSNTDNYGYDLLNRLTSFTGPSTSQSFTYDAVGNRSTQVIGANTYNYAYSGSSNRISSVSGPVARTFTHDANGSITGDTLVTSTYDNRGRLASVTTGAGTTNYKLNFLGQRVRKTDASDDTVYHYDHNGKLIAESTAAGTIQREYVYLGDMPVAVLVGGTPYFIHADQINTPRAVADGTGQIVWLWESDPFGTTAPNEDPDADTVLFTLNLRFPGQYFDKETNTHYNYFRDYDSAIGRYVQSDPIGLEGEISTYAYVGSNSLSHTDPLGLSWEGAWRSVNDLWRWSQGNLGNPNYGANDPISQDLKQTPMMNDIRRQFQANGCKDGLYCGNFQYGEFFSTGSVVGQTVGSFCARLTANGSMINVDAQNTWGLESATRLPQLPGLGSNRGNASVQQMITGGSSIFQWPKSILENTLSGGFANATTRYQWTEPNPCCK